VAGARWAVEECFRAARNETALDHYQVRKDAAWYRRVTWPCALPLARGHRCWPPAAPGDQQRRARSRQRERDPPDARDLAPSRAPARSPPALVRLAPQAPGPRPLPPLPATARARTRSLLTGPLTASRPAGGAPTTRNPDRPADRAVSDAGRPRPRVRPHAEALASPGAAGTGLPPPADRVTPARSTQEHRTGWTQDAIPRHAAPAPASDAAHGPHSQAPAAHAQRQ
jgi:hypothetical protein